MANDRAGAPLTDAELIRRTGAGDAAAFEILVRRYYAAAFAIALANLCHREDAEDLCQEAFVTASRHLGDCHDPARFRSWLFAIVRNGAHNARRARAVRSAISLDDVVVPSRDSPARDLDRAELRGELERALGHLTTPQREVVLLHDMEGWTHREIGDSLSISDTMSRQHLFVARRALRAHLTQRGIGPSTPSGTR